MIIGLHAALASVSGIEELAITDQEGEAFMAAAQNVARHYSVATTQKTMDWIAFVGCAAGLYVPRVFAVGLRRAERRRAEAPSAPFDRMRFPDGG